MKTTNKERTLQWINNQYKKGNISFSHKLQRPVGQWNTRMKSLLIHSLLYGFPINPVYVVEENNIIYTLDGSQRTSICIDYVNDVFSLSKDTPDITIVLNENGERVEKTYQIAGKKFSKLDDEVKNSLLACSLEFCTLSEYTDSEVKEMFRRQNSSKPVNSKLLRICNESDAFSEVIYSLSHHPLMRKLITPTQRKNGTDRDIIIQSFMLILTNQENDYTSFRTKDIDAFIRDCSDAVLEKSNVLKEAMDKLNEAFEDIKIPVTSIPMVLYSCYRVLKDKKSFSRLTEIIQDFINNYDQNEDYKQYLISGTTSSTNVRGRFDWWRNKIRTL